MNDNEKLIIVRPTGQGQCNRCKEDNGQLFYGLCAWCLFALADELGERL